MFFKIFLVISLIAIGSGAPPAYPQDKANQATYSQSFVREDVPVSYQYSAVHYYNPKGHFEPKLSNLKRNHYDSASHNVSYKDIQYAAVPQKPNKHSAERVLYTSVTPTSHPSLIAEYEQYEGNDNYDESAASKQNLEPKPVPIEVKDIKPSTYKPHLNHHVKIYNSPNFQSHIYHRQNTQTTGGVPREFEMEILRRINISQPLQYPTQKAKNIVSPATESIKYANVFDPVTSFLPKQNIPLVALPLEYKRYSSLQSIPRLAYHNKKNVINISAPSEKSRRIQMYSRHNNYIHLKKPNTIN